MNPEPDLTQAAPATAIENAPETLVLADRGWYLAIEFRYTASPRFDRVVRAACKHPGFSLLLDQSGSSLYRVVARQDELELVQGILHAVAGWKGTRCYLCGRETAPDTISSWLPCYVSRHRSMSPSCRRRGDAMIRLRSLGCTWSGISLQLEEPDCWLRCGSFDRSGLYQIHKPRLKARLAAWEKTYGGCPFADSALLHRVLECLPDRIDPTADRRWRVTCVNYSTEQWTIRPSSVSAYYDFLREVVVPASRE